MSEWSARTVIITGATGGLGRELVSKFHSSGARVHAVSRSAPSDPISGVDYYSANLGDEAAVRKMFASIATTPWAVINTVGGFAPHRPIIEFDTAEFQTQYQLNLLTAAVLTKHAVQAMRKRGRGRIIHTASRSATHTQGAGFAYSVSKAGVLHLVKMAAAECADSDIRVHAVSPGIIDTATNRAAMPNTDHGGWAKPADISRAYLFLAAPKSPAKSGTTITV